MTNNILANELDRIADLYEETNFLQEECDDIIRQAKKEMSEVAAQYREELVAYQDKRESEMKGLVLDLKWLRDHPIPKKPSFPEMEEYVVPSSSQNKATSSEDEKKEKTQTDKPKNAKDVMSCLTDATMTLGCGSFVFSLILAYVLNAMFSVPYVVPVIVVLVLWLLIKPFVRASFYNDFKVYLEILDKNKKKMEDWKVKVEQWIEAKHKWAEELEKFGYEKLVGEVCAAAEAYDAEFHKMVSDCDVAYSEAEARLAEENGKIKEKHRLQWTETQEKLNAKKTQLSAVTLLHPDMFSRASKFAEAIRMGRADTVKEAINIVLDDERRDEEEAQRRREAAERQAVLEEQAAAMERAAEQQAAEARRHNEQMEKAAQKQAQQDLADLQRRRNQAARRCFECANGGSCSFRQKSSMGESGTICPSFRPKQR